MDLKIENSSRKLDVEEINRNKYEECGAMESNIHRDEYKE